ncbi:hypothetical protein GIB67_026500 [Kingdonia uniflora]|uniref:Apple domain-containing protein n=1 Tax=Kingdonia uniflora TaxID=39325 RepID=A0A7J7PBT5_9MAGN|nr:hypothetical protein GIB67_026500 [Kingdonia uniflora]
MEKVKVPDFPNYMNTVDVKECEQECLKNCSCVAYSYTNGIRCLIWNGNLLDMQKLLKAGADLFIRAGHKDIGKKIKYMGGLYFKGNEETSINFSDSNMLGENPELPVFTMEKGKFSDGQEITIKRLSKSSGQG